MNNDLERKAALIKRLANDKEAMELIAQLERENKELKKRVIYWEHFFSETIRLFGDSKIELGKALAKSLKILRLHCWAYAEDSLRPIKPSGNLNLSLINKAADIKLRKEFSKKHPMPLVRLEYILLTNEPSNDAQRYYEATTGAPYKAMSKLDAIEKLKQKHHFEGKTSSFMAYLDRYSDIPAADLPSRRTLENKED